MTSRPFSSCFLGGIAVFLFVTLLSTPSLSGAQEMTADRKNLTDETLRVIHKDHEFTVVWWIPDDFWRMQMAENSGTKEKDIDEFIAPMHPFTVVVFIHGKFQSYGEINYDSDQIIRDNLILVDGEGTKYEAMDLSKTSANLGKILDRMKPRFAAMLGSLGKNFNFYIFPAIGKDGKRIADPKKEGSFALQFKEQKFSWKLPLDALLPLKTCPKCHEKLSGAFKYCPYDGTPLPD